MEVLGDRTSGIRLAEVVATLSLAADLGLGQPSEHAIGSCRVALRLADTLGASPAERASTYWVNLLAWVGCTADSHELAQLFGDDIALRADSYRVDLAGPAELAFLLRHAGASGSLLDRVATTVSLVAGNGAKVERALLAHCEVADHLATRFGLDAEVGSSIAHAFARWDGKGLPAGVAGPDIPLPARILHLADIVVAHYRRGGVAAAIGVARARRGTQFDPDVVDAFCSITADALDDLVRTPGWGDVVSCEPALDRTLTDAELDSMLEILADFADLKSPFFLGHSRGVAELVAAAAHESGRSDGEVRLGRRAGLVHDLGRAGIPNTIWDKPGPLTPGETERVRLHDYYVERMLQQPVALAEIGAVASAGHERSDGSGYHRGTSGPGSGRSSASLSRLLAAADAYHAMCEARPHRPEMSPGEAAAELRREAGAGSHDRGAVEAVLGAAGHRRRGRPAHPGGLSPREIEVLVLLARGASNKQIAQRLGIAVKTAGSHVEHIYAKLGVSTRAAAALFAIQHGLVPDLEPLS